MGELHGNKKNSRRNEEDRGQKVSSEEDCLKEIRGEKVHS